MGASGSDSRTCVSGRRCAGTITNDVGRSVPEVTYGRASADNQAIFLQVPGRCDSASKVGSSEDSDADQYYVYGPGRPLESFS